MAAQRRQITSHAIPCGTAPPRRAQIERRSRLLLPRRNREVYGHAGVSPVEPKLGLEESRLAV
jgi:hypothetical protein